MGETIKDIFTADEWDIISDFEKDILEKAKELPIELTIEWERMGEPENE